MDEPSSGLDAENRERVLELIESLCTQDKSTVLMVTHDIDEAVHVSDRVLVMDADPGTVRAAVTIALPRPRDREHRGVPALAAQVREQLHAVHAF